MTESEIPHYKLERAVAFTILVAALGYFVDIFDLLMFSIVRVPSLKTLNVPDTDLLSVGIRLINIQMAGLLVGGVLWGVIGDRRGRKSVLFGSILLYSLANLANCFVHNVAEYGVLRFIAGVGLAGELGAGVTLASELLPQRWRGLGATFISVVGLFGAGAAVTLSKFADWRTVYIIGGVLGFCLLALRVNVRESAMHKQLMDEAPDIARGNILMLFSRWKLLKRFTAVVLIGAPFWGFVGLFITFAPEFAKALGLTAVPTVGNAVLFCYLGLSAGGAVCGLLSQHLKSRRAAVTIFLGLLTATVALYVLFPYNNSLSAYYLVCGLLGAAGGYWPIFTQLAAEQFGTNIRATAATAAPNIVRGLTIPITIAFHFLTPHLGVVGSGVGVVAFLIALAFAAIASLPETFSADLNYTD